MKLTDIILENSQVGFTSSEPKVVNKTTGTIQWDITPTPLKAAINQLDDTLESLEAAVKDNPEDVKLLKYKEALSKLKKSLKAHITRTYGR